MKNKSKLFIYILLNIIISSVTIIFVMWLWEKSHQPEVEDLLAARTPISQSEQTTTNGSDPKLDASQPGETPVFVTGDFDVAITTIVGPGNLDLEHVEISNQGQGAVDTTGWQLKDEDDQTYTFPAIILNNGGAVKILSKKGTDTVIELYWQSDTPIWEPGETARLIDNNGNIIATYSIP